MKFNLKKLKEILQQNATRWMIIKDTEEWFEGFEKELREIADSIDETFEDDYVQVKKFITEEVLGE